MSEFVRNEKWNTISEIGELFVEELLVVSSIPVLFVCTNGINQDRYLIMTYDYYEL